MTIIQIVGAILLLFCGTLFLQKYSNNFYKVFEPRLKKFNIIYFVGILVGLIALLYSI